MTYLFSEISFETEVDIPLITCVIEKKFKEIQGYILNLILVHTINIKCIKHLQKSIFF